MSKILIILLCVFKFTLAKRCSYVFDDDNVFKTIQCVNVNSMDDISEEIKSNWTSIEIINKATHPKWSNNAVNVPYLGVIQTLNLSRAGVLILTETGFRDYDALRVLDLSSSDLTVMKPSWFARKTIEVLDISKNLLKALKKDDMNFFDRLRVFDASANDIKTLEANTFIDSKKLERLILNDNSLDVVLLDNLGSLKTISLRGNSIATIKAVSFRRLPRLETLILAENEITSIEARSFFTLESLKYLNLSNNKLPNVHPFAFNGAGKAKLEHIDLSFNLITMIYPMSLSELTLLTFLDVSNNKIKEIYEKNFATTTSLQTLIISYNQIAKIAPKSFEKLLSLRTLDISNNKLTIFTPELFGDQNFAGNKLRQLNLSKNSLTSLRVNLFSLFVGLTILELSGNKLKTVPAELLTSNVNLQKLSINNNQIESLPESFFKNLLSLQEFSISSNRISSLPSLTGPKRLLKLSIGNNPWQCSCLREIIVTSRKTRIQLDNVNFLPPFPSCVVLPEELCIKDSTLITNYQIYDKFVDGISAVETETGKKRFEA